MMKNNKYELLAKNYDHQTVVGLCVENCVQRFTKGSGPSWYEKPWFLHMYDRLVSLIK